MAKFISYLVCTFAWVIFYVYEKSQVGYNPIRLVDSLDDWITYFIVGFVIYFIIGEFLTRFFDNWFYKRSVAKSEKKQELAEINRQNIELDKKRRELEIEYEHLEKILRLQASIDEGKIGKLGEMQNNLKSQKMSDLKLLRQQIERMKKG